MKSKVMTAACAYPAIAIMASPVPTMISMSTETVPGVAPKLGAAVTKSVGTKIDALVAAGAIGTTTSEMVSGPAAAVVKWPTLS